MTNETDLKARQYAMWALALILPAPLLGITASLYLPSFNGFELGQAIWFFAKVWLFLFPALWLVFVDKERFSSSATNLVGVMAGFAWVCPVAGIIFIAWLLAREFTSFVDEPGIKNQIEQLGLATPQKFWVFAVAISFLNALMEEYVWRWFVFSKCKVLLGKWRGILLASLFFTLHHVIVVWNFGDFLLIVFASTGIFTAGVLWTWMYNKYNSIWPGYISHVAADLAVMWIAWDILTS